MQVCCQLHACLTLVSISILLVTSLRDVSASINSQNSGHHDDLLCHGQRSRNRCGDLATLLPFGKREGALNLSTQISFCTLHVPSAICLALGSGGRLGTQRIMSSSPSTASSRTDHRVRLLGLHHLPHLDSLESHALLVLTRLGPPRGLRQWHRISFVPFRVSCRCCTRCFLLYATVQPWYLPADLHTRVLVA